MNLDVSPKKAKCVVCLFRNAIYVRIPWYIASKQILTTNQTETPYFKCIRNAILLNELLLKCTKRKCMNLDQEYLCCIYLGFEPQLCFTGPSFLNNFLLCLSNSLYINVLLLTWYKCLYRRGICIPPDTIIVVLLSYSVWILRNSRTSINKNC